MLERFSSDRAKTLYVEQLKEQLLAGSDRARILANDLGDYEELINFVDVDIAEYFLNLYDASFPPPVQLLRFVPHVVGWAVQRLQAGKIEHACGILCVTQNLAGCEELFLALARTTALVQDVSLVSKALRRAPCMTSILAALPLEAENPINVLRVLADLGPTVETISRALVWRFSKDHQVREALVQVLKSAIASGTLSSCPFRNPVDFMFLDVVNVLLDTCLGFPMLRTVCLRTLTTLVTTADQSRLAAIAPRLIQGVRVVNGVELAIAVRDRSLVDCVEEVAVGVASAGDLNEIPVYLAEGSDLIQRALTRRCLISLTGFHVVEMIEAIENFKLFNHNADVRTAIRSLFQRTTELSTLAVAGRVMSLQGDVEVVLARVLTMSEGRRTLLIEAVVRVKEAVAEKLAGEDCLGLIGQMLEDAELVEVVPELLSVGCERHSLTAFSLVVKFFELVEAKAGDEDLRKAGRKHLGRWWRYDEGKAQLTDYKEESKLGYFWIIQQRCSDVNRVILHSIWSILLSESSKKIRDHFNKWSGLVLELHSKITLVSGDACFLQESSISRVLDVYPYLDEPDIAIILLSKLLDTPNLIHSNTVGNILKYILETCFRKSSPSRTPLINSRLLLLALSLARFAQGAFTSLFKDFTASLLTQLQTASDPGDLCGFILPCIPLFTTPQHEEALLRFLLHCLESPSARTLALEALKTAVDHLDCSRFLAVLVRKLHSLPSERHRNVRDLIVSSLFTRHEEEMKALWPGTRPPPATVPATVGAPVIPARLGADCSESGSSMPPAVRRRSSVFAIECPAPEAATSQEILSLFLAFLNREDLASIVLRVPPCERAGISRVAEFVHASKLLPFALLAVGCSLTKVDKEVFRAAIEKALLKRSAVRSILLECVDVLDRCDRSLGIDRDVIAVASAFAHNEAVGARYGLIQRAGTVCEAADADTVPGSIMTRLSTAFASAKASGDAEALNLLMNSLTEAAESVSKHPRSFMTYVTAVLFNFVGENSLEFDMNFDLFATSLPDDLWLLVLPQLLSQLAAEAPGLRYLVQRLLIRLGINKPHAVMFSLLASSTADEPLILSGARAVLDVLSRHHPVEVEQYKCVSGGLSQLSSLPGENWLTAIEAASGCFYQSNDIDAMLATLEPLYEELSAISRAAASSSTTITSVFDVVVVTPAQRQFSHTYGPDLFKARQFTQRYVRERERGYVEEAWRIYYRVFQRLSKELRDSLVSLDLGFVCPELLDLRESRVVVPGGPEGVTIAAFRRTVRVMTSKQRPRMVEVLGSDGKSYRFLLKGREDLALDQRVMQIFGLMNELLGFSALHQYEAIRLSGKAGLIEWVPQCDTVHSLIKRLRETRGAETQAEFAALRRGGGGQWEELPLVVKTEVFKQVMGRFSGDEVERCMLMQTESAQEYLAVRRHFSESLAVTSIAGYILGVGDRHPSNLMIHRGSGRIVHIDFGDLFDANLHRDKFPEKIPFRLTKQLIQAADMPVFKKKSQAVLDVFRANSHVLETMIDVFVRDPGIAWTRKPQDPSSVHDGDASEEYGDSPKAVVEAELPDQVPLPGSFDVNLETGNNTVDSLERMRKARAQTTSGDAWSSHAEHIMARVRAKLDGTVSDRKLTVSEQVDFLISQATSEFNLAQCYIGWCPFW